MSLRHDHLCHPATTRRRHQPRPRRRHIRAPDQCQRRLRPPAGHCARPLESGPQHAGAGGGRDPVVHTAAGQRQADRRGAGRQFAGIRPRHPVARQRAGGTQAGRGLRDCPRRQHRQLHRAAAHAGRGPSAGKRLRSGLGLSRRASEQRQQDRHTDSGNRTERQRGHRRADRRPQGGQCRRRCGLCRWRSRR